jgi:hypothetical protein
MQEGAEPDRWRPRCMLLDPNSRRLAVREQADTIEARVPHTLDDQIGCAGQHVPPIPGKFDGSGQQCGDLLDRWGNLSHGCKRFLPAKDNGRR